MKKHLICVPHAGADGSWFVPLASSAPADWSVHPLSLPGRGRRIRETAFSSARDVLQALDDIFLMIDSESSIVVLGNCSGADVALRLAARIRDRGIRQVPLVIAASSLPPNTWKNDNWFRTDEDDEALSAELIAAGFLPKEVADSEEMRNILLPTIRADLAMTRDVRSEFVTPEDLQVIALRGRQDERITPARFNLWLSWNRKAEIRTVSGGHFFLKEQPEVIWTILAKRALR